MIELAPVVLEGHGVRLEPLAPAHVEGLVAAASDGELWRLFVTSVPEPSQVEGYVERALAADDMLAWAVVDGPSGEVIGSTRYHDVVAEIDRVEIGWTWYAATYQRTHVNTACKLLLLEHAFEGLGCAVVGFRTDGLNHRSQRAIEALGAQKDGVIRHHKRRRDGSVRDSVLYSILAHEWDGVRKHLESRLWRNAR